MSGNLDAEQRIVGGWQAVPAGSSPTEESLNVSGRRIFPCRLSWKQTQQEVSTALAHPRGEFKVSK